MKTLKSLTAFTILFFCFSTSSHSQNKTVNNVTSNSAVEKKADLKTSLEAGDIKLTLTGIDDGLKLNILIDRNIEKSMVIYIPKGKSKITFGSTQLEVVEIDVPQEIKIDLSKTTSQTVIVDQSSKQKIIKGSIIIESNSGTTSYNYQNVTIGLK